MNKVFCSCPTSLGILHVFLRQDNVANLSLSMGMEIFIETLKDSEGDIRLSLISKRELFVEIICEFFFEQFYKEFHLTYPTVSWLRDSLYQFVFKLKSLIYQIFVYVTESAMQLSERFCYSSKQSQFLNTLFDEKIGNNTEAFEKAHKIYFLEFNNNSQHYILKNLG